MNFSKDSLTVTQIIYNQLYNNYSTEVSKEMIKELQIMWYVKFHILMFNLCQKASSTAKALCEKLNQYTVQVYKRDSAFYDWSFAPGCFYEPLMTHKLIVMDICKFGYIYLTAFCCLLQEI